jgi:glycosyltransferase involved in cell wall biosynthesis
VPLTLYVAGDDPDRTRFMQHGTRGRRGERVIFGGFRNDMPQALASADLFLFPSWYEAFSLATIEAAACGLPVSPRASTARRISSPRRKRRLRRARRRQRRRCAAPALRQPQHLKVMGANARERVEMNYTWDRIAQMTEDAYRAHLSNSN